MQKNELAQKVHELLDAACGQVVEQMREYRKAKYKILEEFENLLEQKIEQADKRLVELIENRPTPQTIMAIENSVVTLEKEVNTLSHAEAPQSPSGSIPPVGSEFDTVFGKK